MRIYMPDEQVCEMLRISYLVTDMMHIKMHLLFVIYSLWFIYDKGCQESFLNNRKNCPTTFDVSLFMLSVSSSSLRVVQAPHRAAQLHVRTASPSQLPSSRLLNAR